MFEVIPVVNKELKDGHYFRNYLDRLNSRSEPSYPGHVEYISKCAKLEQLEESLRSSVKSINGKFVFIGEILSIIDRERLYGTVHSGMSDNYCNDVYRYAFVRFGLKKTTTFNLVSIARIFAVNGELLRKWKDYSYSQLCEMISMSDEDREKVNPSMTVKQIREMKNTLSLQSDTEIQTSEFDESSTEVVVLPSLNDIKRQKLIELLVEGDEKHFWQNGRKNFEFFADWLIEQGVSVKI